MFALLALTACQWIDQAELDRQLDADNDGIERDVDCDDSDASIGGPPIRYFDSDGDGFGDPQISVQDSCVIAAPWVAGAEDCDDSDAGVFPGADELCNTVDDDCDGLIDDDDPQRLSSSASAWLPDDDQDGFPSDRGELTVLACAAPDGFVSSALEADCDDSTAEAFPENPERCADFIDNDCDGEVDESGVEDAEWYVDDDGDGWPSNFTAVQRCNDGAGSFVPAAGFDPNNDPEDCAPDDPTRSPGFPEVYYDGIDANCDGADDYDQDGDLFVPPAFASASTLPAGDCDDTDPAVAPGTPESCNGIDDDCDGLTDDPPVVDPGLFALIDNDLDGFPSEDEVAACVAGPGLIDPATAVDRDCDDSSPIIFPGAAEQPDDGVDQDCSGFDTLSCFADLDGDGVGGAAEALVDGPDCGDSSAAAAGDCNDNDAEIFPGATDWCDEIDQNCDGIDPVGTATVFTMSGNRFDLPSGPLDLTDIEAVQFCGGTFDTEFVSTTNARASVAGLKGYVTVLAPSGPLLSGGTSNARLHFENLQVEASGDALWTAHGPGAHLSLVQTTVSGTTEAVIDAEQSTVVLEGVMLGDVTATGVAPLRIAAGSHLEASGLEVRSTSGIESGGLAIREATAELEDVQFEDVMGVDGGAISIVSGDLELRSSSISGATANRGGAIFTEDANLALTELEITTARANVGGAIAAYDSTIVLTRGSIIGADATGEGGGIAGFDASVISQDTEWTDNTAVTGGAIYTAGTGLVLLLEGTLSQNMAVDSGGALHCQDAASCVVQDSRLARNTASAGGAVFVNQGASLRISDAFLSENIASFGGAVFAAGAPGSTLSRTQFDQNEATSSGGAVHTTEDLLAEDCEFTSNIAIQGGAIHSPSGTGARVTLNSDTFDGNRANRSGGALHTSFVSAYGTVFRNNSAADGGAVYGSNECFGPEPGLLELADTDFFDNTATGAGGAISILTSTLGLDCGAPDGDTRAEIVGDFTGNSAQLGGAVASAVSPVGIWAETRFEANTAERGGAIYGAIGAPVVGDLQCIGSPFYFIDNVATVEGGAWVATGANFHTFQCRVASASGNTAPTGSVVVVESGSVQTIWTQDDNVANDGIEVLLAGGELDWTDFETTSPVTVAVPGVAQECEFPTSSVFTCTSAAGCTPCP